MVLPYEFVLDGYGCFSAGPVWRRHRTDELYNFKEDLLIMFR